MVSSVSSTNLICLSFRKEFAEYTSAQERIALGKKSRKVEAAKRRDTMKEMIADAYVKPYNFFFCF